MVDFDKVSSDLINYFTICNILYIWYLYLLNNIFDTFVIDNYPIIKKTRTYPNIINAVSISAVFHIYNISIYMAFIGSALKNCDFVYPIFATYNINALYKCRGSESPSVINSLLFQYNRFQYIYTISLILNCY